MTLQIVSREAWGAREPRGRELVAWSDRRLFVVHHTTGTTLGDPDPETWLRNIQRHHMDGNGWADFGYNFAVDYEGRVYEGRGAAVLGAHVAGHNTEGVGVAVLGDYRKDHDDLTDPIRRAVRDLWLHVNGLAGRRLTPTGHGQLAATACPGHQLAAYVEDGLPDPDPDTPPARPKTRPAPGPEVDYPLSSGYYFGPARSAVHSVSGHYGRSFRGRLDREWIQEWVRQLVRRGWPAGKGRRYLNRYGSDGRYGPEHAELIRAFQRDQGLRADGLLGVRTWTAAYRNPVTP